MPKKPKRRINPPPRDLNTPMNRNWSWIRDWLHGTRKLKRSVATSLLWRVASWIYDRCLGFQPQYNPGCRRRLHDGRAWIVFSSGACSDALDLPPHHVSRSLTKLIELGLVESHTERACPRDAEGRCVEDDGWHGPETLVVRVKLLLPME